MCVLHLAILKPRVLLNERTKEARFHCHALPWPLGGALTQVRSFLSILVGALGVLQMLLTFFCGRKRGTTSAQVTPELDPRGPVRQF